MESAFSTKEEAKYFSGGLSSRVRQWELIVSEVEDNHPFFGFGVGDADKAYQQIYTQNNLEWAAENKFNAHSMYVESFFLMGLAGLISLLGLFAYVFREALKQRSLVYLSFLFLFLVAGLTESLLNRQYGIVFFVFMASVLYNGTNSMAQSKSVE